MMVAILTIFVSVPVSSKKSTKRTLNFNEENVMGSGERVPVVGTTFLRIDDTNSLI